MLTISSKTMVTLTPFGVPSEYNWIGCLPTDSAFCDRAPDGTVGEFHAAKRIIRERIRAALQHKNLGPVGIYKRQNDLLDDQPEF